MPGSLVRTQPPSGDVVSLADAKAFARVEDTVEDALSTALLRAAVDGLDGPKGAVRRALLTQGWELRLDDFPSGPLVLPLPPVQSISGIDYTASGGASATLAPGDLVLSGAGTDCAIVAPRAGAAWPLSAGDLGSVRVRFVTGYGQGSDVPAPIRTAIMIAFAALFDGRGSASDPYSGAAKTLLAPFRRPVFA